MRRSAYSLLAIPLLVLDYGHFEPHDRRPCGPDEQAVRAAVMSYFEGIREASAPKLAEAFHPEAFLVGLGQDGSLLRLSFAEWTARMTQPVPTDLRGVIESVDIAGDAAMVKTVLLRPRVKYVDYLSLLRVDGEWRIVNKVWNEARIEGA